MTPTPQTNMMQIEMWVYGDMGRCRFIARYMSGGRASPWKASVSPPTAPSTEPKNGAATATAHVPKTSPARMAFWVQKTVKLDDESLS